MDREEALAWLDGLGAGRIELGLSRISALLDRLGRPDRAYPALHVAGTNGKGSTCAMAAATLQAAGLRVGLYTSPHLVDFEERIAIGGTPITADALATAATAVRNAAEGIPLTYFEAGTAVALHAFRQVRVDVAVLETGLGGRLDATNAVTPAACAITTLGLDHVELLGPTLAHVAGEKAGILKPGVPCVAAASAPEAIATVERKAREVGSPLLVEGQDFTFAERTYRGPRWTVSGVQLALRGPHQLHNAAVAIALLEASGLPVGPGAVRAGLSGVRWPGRLEAIERPEATVVLDGAHNPQGAEALAAALRALWPGKQPVFVFGVLADKDAGSMMAALFPLAARVVLVPPRSPRARAPETLAEAARPFCRQVVTLPALASALADALARPGADRLVVVCGSLYLLGEARGRLLH